ncbi:MAG: TraB/GumN family protein, partial [Flavobacterium sp.]
MKLKFLIVILFLSAIIYAQEKKYQSLLWEISGKGLDKKSYIYGTMHMSDKVSYHLSDAFFTHLLAADMVANESNPETWKALDEMININLKGLGFQKFYTQFYRYPIEKKELIEIFDNKSYILENLLYRTNEKRKEYQEETYLDMFIHQTGRKYKKLTPSLEDVKEAYMLISSTEPDYQTPDEDKINKINKLLRNKTAEEVMVDYYREKNLDDLDELYSLVLPRNYLEALLLERNRIMVKNMDSLMKKGSLFAAMGAAHIPGEEGVVNILRKKGYTVKPIIDNYTQKGKTIKKKIEEYFLKPIFTPYSSEDQMIELPLNSLILNNENGFNSPDLTNGGYINVKRTPLFDFLQKENKKFNAKQLDSLFFENIPGNIDEKNYIELSKYINYFDIKNTTKSGNTQRHRFYTTPLEIIKVSMTGNGVYTKNFNEDVFKAIKVKEITNEWIKFQNQKNSFEVELPNYNYRTGNEKNPVNSSNTEIYAFDSSNNSYYFVIENNSGNYNIEDTDYELERIQEEFYNQLGAEPSKLIQKENLYLHTQSKFYDKTIDLKTHTDGVTYYLLGCINCNDQQKNKFFNSFTINKLIKDEDYRKLIQKEGLYSVEVPFKQNEVQFLYNKTKKFEKKKTKNTNLFEAKSFENVYQSQNGSKVTILSYQYHPFDYEKSADSIYKNYKLQFTK